MTDPLGLIGASGGVQPQARPRPVNQPNEADGPKFREVLMQNIAQVNRLQQDAEAAIEDLAVGRRDDVASVMIAKQKADMAFNMLLQVRNKMMDAYEEIKQIHV
jgi:flagellar hook-basal body complex protein FliE